MASVGDYEVAAPDPRDIVPLQSTAQVEAGFVSCVAESSEEFARAATLLAEAVSAEAVRSRMRRLIDSEPPDATLSDDRLVEMLRGEGIEIARRTVAKYREAMRIPSSVQRRREKSLSGAGMAIQAAAL